MKKLLLVFIKIVFVYTLYSQSLYTTTQHGGINGGGTICKLEKGMLSAAFNFDTPDGSRPWGNLLQASDGTLYGMTEEGGKFNVGTIFSYNTLTQAYIKLKDFDTLDGAFPRGGLIQAHDGKLYGIISNGGNDDNGVIFSYNIKTNSYTKLIDFDVEIASFPFGDLVEASNGKLYGITLYGGMDRRGSIFSYSPITNIYKNEIDFNDSNRWNPSGSLLLANDGKLYGMTRFGGVGEDRGVIFSFDPATNIYAKLTRFSDSSGNNPNSSLIQANDGKLYGMTYSGGANDAGVIFSFTITTSFFTKLKDLDTIAGHPHGQLVQLNNGKLYGTASTYNKSGKIVFSFDPLTHNCRLRILKD